MAIWIDPVLPKLATPTWEFLQANPIRFGKLDMVLSPQQWEFCFAPEPFVVWIGGTRSGKSVGAVARGLRLTLWIPGNKGIVGRLTHSDLQDTDMRDFMEYADATGMVKFKNDRKLVMYCCDHEGRALPGKPTSEVLFLHFDKPNHLKGHGIGWYHIAEASEVSPKAHYRLTDRLSHPAAKGFHGGFLTSNPEGRNWLFDYGYNEQKITALKCTEPNCRKPRHPLCVRLMRRAIHNRTKDNPYLTPEYLRMQYANSPEEWIRRYMDGEFDVFEGQIYKEFSHDIHCVDSVKCKGWVNNEPPPQWRRYMGIDAGGVDPWAFECCGVDPWGNLIFYDEIYRPEVYVGAFREELVRLIGSGERNWAGFPMDFENKVAQEELNRLNIGMRVTNAHKSKKVKKSFPLMGRYLHPNPSRAYPPWHPRAGEPGSPGAFFTERVENLVRELPQQRWKTVIGRDGEQMNEPDDKVDNHAVDGSLYILRELPMPEDALLPLAARVAEMGLDKKSAYFYLLEKQEEERRMKHVGRGHSVAPPLRQLPKEHAWP